MKIYSDKYQIIFGKNEVDFKDIIDFKNNYKYKDDVAINKYSQEVPVIFNPELLNNLFNNSKMGLFQDKIEDSYTYLEFNKRGIIQEIIFDWLLLSEIKLFLFEGGGIGLRVKLRKLQYTIVDGHSEIHTIGEQFKHHNDGVHKCYIEGFALAAIVIHDDLLVLIEVIRTKNSDGKYDFYSDILGYPRDNSEKSYFYTRLKDYLLFSTHVQLGISDVRSHYYHLLGDKKYPFIVMPDTANNHYMINLQYFLSYPVLYFYPIKWGDIIKTGITDKRNLYCKFDVLENNSLYGSHFTKIDKFIILEFYITKNPISILISPNSDRVGYINKATYDNIVNGTWDRTFINLK